MKINLVYLWFVTLELLTTVARKRHNKFFCLLKLSRDNSNLSRDKWENYSFVVLWFLFLVIGGGSTSVLLLFFLLLSVSWRSLAWFRVRFRKLSFCPLSRNINHHFLALKIFLWNLATDREPTSFRTDLQRTSNYVVHGGRATLKDILVKAKLWELRAINTCVESVRSGFSLSCDMLQFIAR